MHNTIVGIHNNFLLTKKADILATREFTVQEAKISQPLAFVVQIRPQINQVSKSLLIKILSRKLHLKIIPCVNSQLTNKKPNTK